MTTRDDRFVTRQEAAKPLLVVRGGATAEEVAAVVAVLQGIASARAGAPPPEKPRSEWSAHHRKVRPSLLHGTGGWRASGMPR